MGTPSVASKGNASARSVASSMTSSTKRKHDAGPKFYAVRVGFAPGVYHSWNDCMAQIKGFKGAIFKSFSTLADADGFVHNRLPSHSPAASATPPKFYAVQSGRRPGVYTDWPSAQAQVNGWAKPRHKSFSTRAEAEAFVKAGSPDARKENGLSMAETMQQATGHDVEPTSAGFSVLEDPLLDDAGPAKKKARKSDGRTPAKKQKQHDTGEMPAGPAFFEPGEGPLPEGAEDDFDPRIILNPDTGLIEYKDDTLLRATKVMSKNVAPTAMLKIYTDGSALANGQQGAVAGVGVFFGPGDSRNVSEPLAGPRQTNQRAELTAVQRALDLAPLDRNATIYSDSNYAIQCATVWYKTWRGNGWVTSARKPVENKDLVEQIVNRIEERTGCGATTEFQWLKGHANDPGNTAADALAVNGAREGREARRSESTNGG